MKLGSLLHRSVSISLLQSLVVVADGNGSIIGPDFENILDLPEELSLSTDFESIGTSKMKSYDLKPTI